MVFEKLTRACFFFSQISVETMLLGILTELFMKMAPSTKVRFMKFMRLSSDTTKWELSVIGENTLITFWTEVWVDFERETLSRFGFSDFFHSFVLCLLARYAFSATNNIPV